MSSPSGSSYTSSSPLRSSPLSHPPVYAPTRTPSPGRDRRPHPLPIPSSTPLRRSSLSQSTTSKPSRTSLSPMTSTSPTTSSVSPQATPSPPLSRSQPLLGSYPLSLLHSRMSHAHAPHSLDSSSTSGFSLHLGALGMGRTCPPELRCPRHLVLPFSATYYDLEDPAGLGGMRRKGAGALQSPWVGNINLEDHYFDLFSKSSYPSSFKTGSVTQSAPPSFPGYKVAPVGQLQILVKTPTQAVKVFLVPYDLRSLPVGGRLLARERTYVQSVEASSPSCPQRKEALRYAFQLQFVCVASSRSGSETPSRDSSTTRRRRVTTDTSRHTGSSTASDSSISSTPTLGPSTSSVPRGTTRSQSLASEMSSKDFYVSRNLKVIFTSSPPEKHEELRTERTDELVLPSEVDVFSRQRKVIGFSPGSLGNREEDWETVKMKWNAREEMRGIQAAAGEEVIGIQGVGAVSSTSSEGEERGRSGSYDRPRITTSLSSPSKPNPAISLLSPSKQRLPTIISRPTTPTPQIFDLPANLIPIPAPPSVVGTGIRGAPPIAGRNGRKARRESGSYEERMLSEKLRALKVALE